MRRTQADIDKTVQATQAVIKVYDAWDAATDTTATEQRDLIDILTEDEARLILEKNWYSHSVAWVAALLRLAGPDASHERILVLAMEMDIELWKRRNKAT